VVGVATDRDTLAGGLSEPHAAALRMVIAENSEIIASGAAANLVRLSPDSTGSTVTSGLFNPGERDDPPTPADQLRQFVGPGLPPD
jgi:hypothetical protein